MEDREERLISAIESAANFMRGMTLDPAVPGHAKDALRSMIAELEALVVEFSL